MGANNNEEIEEKLDEEELAAQLKVVRQKKIQQCTNEVQAVLDKYGMTLEAVAVIRADRISIVPRGGV